MFRFVVFSPPNIFFCACGVHPSFQANSDRDEASCDAQSKRLVDNRVIFVSQPFGPIVRARNAHFLDTQESKSVWDCRHDEGEKKETNPAGVMTITTP